MKKGFYLLTGNDIYSNHVLQLIDC